MFNSLPNQCQSYIKYKKEINGKKQNTIKPLQNNEWRSLENDQLEKTKAAFTVTVQVLTNCFLNLFCFNEFLNYEYNLVSFQLYLINGLFSKFWFVSYYILSNISH